MPAANDNRRTRSRYEQELIIDTAVHKHLRRPTEAEVLEWLRNPQPNTPWQDRELDLIMADIVDELDQLL